MKKTSKKYMEKEIKEAMKSMLVNVVYLNPVVVKRNAGHVTLCEVDFMPPSELAKTVSKYCGEKIIFKERDKIKASFDKFTKFIEKKKIKEQKRLNRKAKRKRKKILKAVYRGFAPNPTSFDAKGSETGWVYKSKINN